MTAPLILDADHAIAARTRPCGCTGGPACEGRCYLRGGCSCHDLGPVLGREPTDEELVAHERERVAAGHAPTWEPTP